MKLNFGGEKRLEVSFPKSYDSSNLEQVRGQGASICEQRVAALTVSGAMAA